MISKISSVDNKKYTPNWNAENKNPAFQGLGDAILAGVQACERNPMLNVSVLDMSTAILPRTYIETKESNAYAGMEAFRRESSGLIVNCLLPSFIVMGMAGLLQKLSPFKGLKGMSNVWANEESLKIVQKYLEKAEGTGSKKLENAIAAFTNDLTGVDGSAKKAFKDFDLKHGIRKISRSVDMPAYRLKNPEKLVQKGYEDIAKITHMTEHLELGGKTLSKNYKGYIEDFVNVFKTANRNGAGTSGKLPAFIQKSIKLVNWKSLAGLGVIIPLAISMQPINRWITSKQSGVKGAPIYKDYKETEHRELTPKEKSALFRQKIISIGSMIGVMLLSMGKIPNKDTFRQMMQFKGIFPTMDQARFISTATFASRMAASEDKNELREATVRDIATFSALYFLGDYAAKGVATLIEKIKPDIKLLNTLKELPKDAGMWKKFTHWVKDVNLKSSDYNQIPVRDRSLRGKIQMVFQNSLDAVNLHMDIFHTVSEPLENFFTMSKAGRRAETVRLLETVGLCAEDLDKYPRQLSGGQLQRICIARALAVRPELLLLDEPLSSLDVSVQAQILNLLSDLKKELNLSCILVSHDLKVVYYLADELIVMYGGGVVEKLEDIERFRELCHPYTRRLLMAHEWEDRPDRGKKASEKILFNGKKSKAETESKEGCVYVERCPYVTAQCLVARPELVQRTSGHWVACYR